MAVFRGTLRMAGDVTSLPALVTIEQGTISLSSSRHAIGQWRLEGLSIASRSDGFHIRVEGEEIVLTLLDPPGFAATISPSALPPTRRAARPLLRVVGSPFAPAVAGLVVLVLLAVLAPTVLAVLLLLPGGVALLAGLLGWFDPTLAARLPGKATPSHAVLGGAGLIVLSALVYAID